MSISGIVSGAYGLGKAIGFKPGDFITNVFGGGSDCNERNKQEAAQIAQDLHEYTTRAERVRFIKSTGSSLDRIPASPEKMAFFYIGEDDCKHKNVASRHQRYLSGLKPFISRKKRQKQTALAKQSQAQDKASGSTGTGAQLGGLAPVLKWAFFGGVLYMLYNLVTLKK